MMKAQVTLFLAFACLFFQSCIAVGTCETDEICGYTDVDLLIPQFSSTHARSTLLTVEDFRAISDNGFSLATVGGITFNGEQGVSISGPDDIRLSAPVGGDFVIQGRDVHLNAGDLNYFTVADEAIIDTIDDINLSVPAGTIDFHSHFETKFSSVNGMILSSSNGDVRILAPEGTANIRGDTIGLVGGSDEDQGISVQSFDKMLVKADREFDLFSESDIEFNATTTLSINSKINNIELEAGDLMTISAESNVISSAANDIVLESLLGDMNIDTKGAFSMYARNLQHKSNDVSLTSNGNFIVDGTGHANFISKKDHVLTIDNGLIVAIESLQFRGTSDGDITFDLNSLTQTSSDLRVQAADLADSSIQFTTGNLAYSTTNSDIHMESHGAAFNVVDDTKISANEFSMYGSRYHYTPGPLDNESGLIALDTVASTQVNAESDIEINSDNLVSISSGTDISMSAGDNFEISSLKRTSFLADNIDFSSENEFFLESGTNSQFQADSSLTVSGGASNNLLATNEFITTSSGLTDIEGGQITMQSITGEYFVRADTFHVDAVEIFEIDANEDDDQFTSFFTPQELSLLAGQTEIRADNVLTFQVPSGAGTFSAGDEIEFKSFDGYFASVTGSINFNEGSFIASADEIYFRSGNDLFVNVPDNTVDINSIQTDIISSTSVDLTSDTLELQSEEDIFFQGDNSVSFFSESDLDLSPLPEGDFRIFGGRVDIIALEDDITITGDHTASITSDDYNNIEFFANDNLNVDATGDITFDAKHFNLFVGTEFRSFASETLSFVTNDGHLLFSSVGHIGDNGSPTTTISVDGAATYTADNFLAHSFSKDGNWNLTGEPIEVTGDTITFDGEGGGYFDFTTPTDISFTGEDMIVEFLVNNQETPSDYLVSGDVDLKSCDGDIRTLTGEFIHSGPTLFVSQIVDPCGDCPTCVAGDFKIVTHSEFTQTYGIENTQLFTANNELLFQGGRVDYLSSGMLTVNSGSSINIVSQNDDSRLVDSFDDKVYAGRQVLIDSVKQMTFESVGFVDLPDTPEILNGFEIDVHQGALQFLIPTASFNAMASEDHIRISSGNFVVPSNIEIQNTRDLIIDGGEGQILLHAHEHIQHKDAVDDSSIQFQAVLGSFDITTDQANVVFSANQDLVTDTRLGKITWIAEEGISHVATEHDAQLLYNPLLDVLEFTIEQDIMLTAGTETYDSDIKMTAARDFSVFTEFEQRYLSTGPNTNEGEDSISLRGDEGPIRITTPMNQQIFASGNAHFESQTDQLTVTAENDISLLSTSESYLLSQFDFPIDVSDGNIELSAGGGGGSVSLISDASQGILAVAQNAIKSTAEDSTFINTRNGLNFTTNLGDITFTQNGDLQNSHYHSEGSMLLQAFEPDGIQFTGLGDFVVNAKRDVLFDATERFSIGSSSDANAATEPSIEFNAGDDTNAGIVFDVLGGMSWTTSRRGPIRFESDRASFTTGEDIALTSNGPIRFTNEGEFDSTGFSIVTQALLTLNGGVGVELSSSKFAKIDADTDITFTATGVQNIDVSVIRSENNLVINADTLTTSTNVLSGEVTDFSIDVNGPIVVTNTAGDGGTFTFESDSTLSTVSVGPIDLNSQGPTDITTDGPNSDILFVSAGDQSVTSNGGLTIEGSSIDFDAPHGTTIQSITGDIEFVASDVIEVRANGTMSLDGNDQVTIEAGLANTSPLVTSQFNISSRGELLIEAQDDFVFDVTEDGQDIRVIADSGLTIENSVSARDQGDIIIESSNNYVMASGADSFIQTGGNVFIESEVLSIESADEMNFVSTHATASILIEAGGITFDSDDEFTLSALTDLTMTAESSFTWEQINEEGFGGIVISSTGDESPTTITSATTITYNAQTRIAGETDGYLLFNVGGPIAAKTNAHGADITFSNQGSGGMMISTNGALQVNRPATGFDDAPIRFNAFGTAADGTSIDFTTTGAIMNINSNGEHSDEFFKAENLVFTNPKTVGSDTDFDSSSSLAIVANGVDREVSPAPNRRLYGVSIESDDTVSFDTNRDIHVESQAGDVIFVASEDFTFDSSQEINLFSGADVLIQTGFTPQPLFQVPDRTGILFSGTSKSSFRSNHHDLSMDAEDVSWSIGTNFIVRGGGSVLFGSSSSNLIWDGTTHEFTAEHITMNSQDILLAANNNFEAISRESMFFQATDEIVFDGSGTGNSITLQADNHILFTTPSGAVTTVTGGDNFLIPPLEDEAGISGAGLPNGDKYRVREENQYPNCEERSFGYDIDGDAFCYCHFNKWRCRDPEPSVIITP